MDIIFDNIRSHFHQMIGWELIAVILAIAYLLLIMRQNSWGWVCAFFSTAIYIFLFWHVSLKMESALNIYYMAMAVYGWLQWHGVFAKQATDHKVTATAVSALPLKPVMRWSIKQHALGLILIFSATLISGYLLQKNTDAAWPYLDSFTTWASVFTTYMVAQKVLENWLYWIVINSFAIFLYIDRELYLTVLLFVVYFFICIFGFISWKKAEQEQRALTQ